MIRVIPVIAVFSMCLVPPAGAKGDEELVARGRVFVDANENRMLDEGEKGVEGVGVSNGAEIVETDAEGRYEIPVTEDSIVFMIKPAGMRTPFSEQMTPEFYYIHKPSGSPPSRHAGVAPTGPLPAAINFPLYPQDEPSTFRALMFGDPQPRNQKEIDYISHDVIEELVGSDAALGVTLGDILFDDLSLFEAQGKSIALLGIPWYNVIGNHDINRDAKSRQYANETFEKHYGPSYYSFDHGPVHFVVLDDIDWIVPDDPSKGKPKYEAGLGATQLKFLENDLSRVDKDQLVVLMMHIPITQIKDKQALFRLIEDRKFCMSISGHTHHHEHKFLKDADGWKGVEPHHHVINVTVSGSWWSGTANEWGIPHATMADGAPNGYSILSFDGNQYKVEFRAAGRPSTYQINVTAPETVAESGKTEIFANVFNGSERTKVRFRVGSQGNWNEMQQSRQVDPAFKAAFDRDKEVKARTAPNLTSPKASTHLWKATLPKGLKIGPQLIHVRAEEEDGSIHDAYRVVRVIEESP